MTTFSLQGRSYPLCQWLTPQKTAKIQGKDDHYFFLKKGPYDKMAQELATLQTLQKNTSPTAPFPRLFTHQHKQNDLFIVMHWIYGFTLHDYLQEKRSFSWHIYQQCTQEALEALQFLHHLQIAHGNITPRALFFQHLHSTRWRVVLGNFSASASASFSNDITSLSCTLVEGATGIPFYPDSSLLASFQPLLQTKRQFGLLYLLLEKLLSHTANPSTALEEAISDPSLQKEMRFIEGNRYKLVKCIHKGVTTTYKVRGLEQYFFLKRPSSIKSHTHILREINILALVEGKIHWTYIIQPIAYAKTNIPALVLEWAGSWNLGQWIQTPKSIVSWSFLEKVTQESLLALQELQTHHIVHCDIKPANIMLYHYPNTDWRIKICDFGLAFVNKASPMKGTHGYLAPEQFSCPTIDARVDIFSLGLTLYEMFLGQPVFPLACEKKEYISYYEHVLTDVYPPSMLIYPPHDRIPFSKCSWTKTLQEQCEHPRYPSKDPAFLVWQHLLKAMLSIDRNKRISLQQALTTIFQETK